MRKKKNGEERLRLCSEYLFSGEGQPMSDPAAALGYEGREVWLEIGAGKGGFAVGMHKANPEVVYFAMERVSDCVTLAAEPFIKGEWLKKGALVMNMADYEVDNDCVKRADKVVVDSWENVKPRMISTVALMWRDGLFRDEDLHAELGEIVIGKKSPRENDDEIIYFNAVGAGIMDIAVTARCYRNAIKAGKGIKLPYWED